MRFLLIKLFLIVFTTTTFAQLNTADRILLEKSHIDKKLELDKSKIIVFAKIKGSNKPMRILGDKLPDDAEATFNILKGESGQVIYFEEILINHNDDWTLELKHFFNSSGQTIVFEKRASYFDKSCVSGLITEMVTDLFTKNFKLYGTIKSIRDTNGNSIIDKNCVNRNQWIIDMKGTSKEILALKNIII